MNQHPDSRRGILEYLKRHGAATIAQLAQELQLTGEGVRQHLLQLQGESFVEPKPRTSRERGRTGRPATFYQLTLAGEHLFPKRYDVVTLAVLDAIGDEFGTDASKRVLSRVTDTLISHDEPRVKDQPLEQRIEEMKTWYGSGDPYMDVEHVDGDYRLIERNCPFFNVAMKQPALCAVSVNALTRLLGVRVEREESFQRGFGRCVFRVYTNEPIEPAKWTFKLENEA